MFTRLTLKHFKAWRERIEIPLAPVTMLLGTNSSGKSSLLQALLLLKQTAFSPDRTIHLNLGGDEANDYFNFGHFDDVLTRGASPRQFEIGFRFKSFRPREISRGEFLANYGKSSPGAVAIQHLTLGSLNKNAVTSRTFNARRMDRATYAIEVDDEQRARGTSRTYSPERSIALPSEAVELLGADGRIVQDISLALRREMKGIAYLGPLRRRPERDYVWNKARPGDLGIDGSGVVNALFASALLRLKEDGAVDVIGEVSSWLQRMGVAERLEIKQLGHSTRYEIVVHKDGIAANLRDVGIGVSQVLPVLTLAFFAPEGSTVLLEEPEIHLHPLAQSVLAELFVEVSNKRNIQFIVETHSEHLFRRMQTLVAKQSLGRNKCCLYFVERQGADAVLNTLKLDEYGRVQDWPEHFFGDAMGETREQARLMFERMRQERAAA